MYYNYANLVGIIKEVNKDERFLKLEINKATTIKISIPEEVDAAFQVPIGEQLGVIGRFTTDPSGAVIVKAERIITFKDIREGE